MKRRLRFSFFSVIKQFAYIGFLLLFVFVFSSATIKKRQKSLPFNTIVHIGSLPKTSGDTTKTKKQEQDDKKRIKEVAKAKNRPKPQKLGEASKKAKPKTKRERRPEGLERPPEIPRRNGN